MRQLQASPARCPGTLRTGQQFRTVYTRTFKNSVSEIAIVHFSVFTHLCGYKLVFAFATFFSGHWQVQKAPLNTEASSSHDRPECLQPVRHHKVCSGRSHRAGLLSPWPRHMLVFLWGNSPKIPPCLQLLVATTVAIGA